MKKFSGFLFVALSLSGFHAQAHQQNAIYEDAVAPLSYFLPDTIEYDKSIPRPADVLGFEVGQFHALHEQGIAYFKAVANVSDRVKLINYGWTNEHKPLYLAIVSSPENIKNLDAIKAEHNKIADPSAQVTITDDTPVFTWLGHSIHGNEASGFNASIVLLYHLAAAKDAKTLENLKHAIIIIDPANNPDGIDRFAEWANQNKSFVDNNDTQEREHLEDWPGGRFNHYLFDLNRDWLNLQQVESQQRVAQILEWHPNIYTCAHEQGTDANYHFSPGAPSRTHPLIFKECMELIGKLASDYYAPAFDNQKMLYFSGEVFDDYYIGRGREYFDFQGGLALLWEEQSARGFLQHSDNGDVSFPLAIHNQLTAQLATIRGSVDLRRTLNEYQRTYFKQSLNEGKATGKSYVFGSKGGDFASTVKFAEVIRRNGINVYRLGKDVSLNGVKYNKDSAFVVPLSQKNYRLIEGIFEIRKHYADSIAYDITGWTMPFSFNLSYAQASGVPTGDAYQIGQQFPSQIIGEQNADKVYAYAFEWSSFYAPRALNRLQKAGIYTKVTDAEITSGNKTFGRGSIFVPLGNVYQKLKPQEIKAVIDQIVVNDFIPVYALNSGYTQGHNVGSSELSSVRTPQIAILGGKGANATSVGALWFLLDQQYHIKASIIPTDRIESLDLDRYNVLIVSGNFPQITEAGRTKIKNWTSNGNTLIATDGAYSLLKKAGIAEFEVKPSDFKYTGNYEDYATAIRAQGIPGVILQTNIDITNPLCWGYTANTLPVFKSNATIFEPIDNPLSVPVTFASPALLSGNLRKALQDRIAGTPVEIAAPFGRGRVIYLAVDATFRGIWYGSSKLLANAIFFGDKLKYLRYNSNR